MVEDQQVLHELTEICRPLLKWNDKKGNKPKSVFLYPDIPDLVVKNAIKRIPQDSLDNNHVLEKDEVPVLILDMAGFSFLWKLIPKWRPFWSFFEEAGSKGLMITTKGIYDNISWYFKSALFDVKRKRFMFHQIRSIKKSKIDNYDKILINGVPLFNFCYQVVPEFDGDFIDSLFKILSDILVKLCPGKLLDLQTIVASYSHFGIVSTDEEKGKEGLERAEKAYEEFNHEADIVLFHKYAKGWLFDSEEQLLITDKHLFSYNSNSEKDHYQFLELATINEAYIEHSRAATNNYCCTFINGCSISQLHETCNAPYNESKWIPYVVFRPYLMTAMICELVNAIREGGDLCPKVRLYTEGKRILTQNYAYRKRKK